MIYLFIYYNNVLKLTETTYSSRLIRRSLLPLGITDADFQVSVLFDCVGTDTSGALASCLICAAAWPGWDWLVDEENVSKLDSLLVVN